MRMITCFLMIAALAYNSAHAQNAALKAIQCPKPDGFLAGPFVANKIVAEAIYRAVITSFAPEKLRHYPIVDAEDEGDHWSVSQRASEPKQQLRKGDIIVSAGGGQLYMNIDKCTGAISGAAFNR
jgi:hypothetical protein